jgi:choline dehydrogenase-like flavoprotein
VDGSAIPVNLGVNPSLTITALAEHAMSQVPAKSPAGDLLPLPAQARAAGVVHPPPAVPLAGAARQGVVK